MGSNEKMMIIADDIFFLPRNYLVTYTLLAAAKMMSREKSYQSRLMIDDKQGRRK